MKYFNHRIETKPLAELRAEQSSRLTDLVRRVSEQVPFYRTKFLELGLDPMGDINSIEQLPQLPITTKEDLRAHYPFGLFGASRDKVARIHCSSGTTGKPTVVGYSKKDLVLMAEVNARSLVAAGAQPGMLLHNAYGYGLFTGGLGLHSGAERLGMNVVPISGGMTDRQVMLIQDFQPEVISCTPSYAQRLADEMEKRQINPDNLSLRFAVLGAEPWTETIRSHVEKGLGVSATNIYGLSEIIGPGVSQEDWEETGTGSYVWEDHFYPEVIDPDTSEPLPLGQEGILLLTTLTKEIMPLIRYRTNDICSLFYDHSVKRTHIKMSAIKGRADTMLIIRGVNVFPTQVEALIGSMQELGANYQLVLSKKDRLDQVTVYVESINKALPGAAVKASVEKQLTTKIRDNIGLSMQVVIQPYGSIPRSEGGKLNRVIDLR
ncbi:MAG: AMP-binding protein [Saprospiraceae bacterium]|nr:AMP-binding protein [Saprospiraceae bacterium]